MATQNISASVTGSYDDYELEINKNLGASCSCPYEGYPCKHVVAVLLAFLDQRENVLEKSKQKKQTADSLKSQVAALPKQELVEMILSCAGKNADFKRELSVRFQRDESATLNAILKDVDKAFAHIESNHYSPGQIAKQLKTILHSVAGAPKAFKADWQVGKASIMTRPTNVCNGIMPRLRVTRATSHCWSCAWKASASILSCTKKQRRY